MRLITPDDIIETYSKLRQRGFGFISSKFNLSESKRTQSAFDESKGIASNWWMIPKVRSRWNKLISGDEKIIYEEYFLNKYLKGQKDLKLLSLGSGACSHEIYFAKQSVFSEVTCVDISETSLNEAATISKELGLKNIHFVKSDISEFNFENDYYDVVLFHSALHHFRNVESLLSEKINKTLKTSGLILINEYVGPNRLQFANKQIKAINEALQFIPKKFRKRFRVNFHKNKVYGPGLLRMKMADPSECVESENILKGLNLFYESLEEKPYGGNILMLLLKDIAHHFSESNIETDLILDKLFTMEDEYLKSEQSDFVFGVYRKKYIPER